MIRLKNNLLFAASLLLLSCGGKEMAKAPLSQEAIPVRLLPIVQDSVSPDFQVSGYFTTDDETPLSFKNGGIINKIYVHEGDAIRKGQLLATVTGTAVDASYNQSRLAYEKAVRDFERASALYKDSVATLEQMQNAKTAMGVTKQQMNNAAFNQQHAEIRALENGFVLKRYLQEGQMAGPGMPVLLVNGAAQDKWLFKTSVSDYQWASIKIGDSATITTDVSKGAVLSAIVLKKSEGIDPQTGGFTLKLLVKNAESIPLASGLLGNATLYSSQKRHVWEIPYDALLDGDSGGGYVFVTNDQKHVSKVKVEIAQLDNKKVVISRGLEHAHYLVISGSAYLENGSAIMVER